MSRNHDLQRNIGMTGAIWSGEEKANRGFYNNLQIQKKFVIKKIVICYSLGPHDDLKLQQRKFSLDIRKNWYLEVVENFKCRLDKHVAGMMLYWEGYWIRKTQGPLKSCFSKNLWLPYFNMPQSVKHFTCNKVTFFFLQQHNRNQSIQI